MGWGLAICLWLGSPWFNYWFSFTLAYSRISHEYSSLSIIVINLTVLRRWSRCFFLFFFMVDSGQVVVSLKVFIRVQFISTGGELFEFRFLVVCVFGRDT